MSSASYDRPIYAVPDIPPSQKARFAALLAMRDAAYRAFDKARSIPRSAIRWAMSLFHRWVEATGSVDVFTWFGGQARNATGLVREVGIVPSLVAVLSTPPIAAAAARAARFVGNGLLRVASAAWTGLKGLLGRCGNTGTRIVEGLSRAGVKAVDVVRVIAKHPMMAPAVDALRATLALVRPVSQGLVAHRLLGALVPIWWLRIIFELLVMPLVIDPSLAGDVRDVISTSYDVPEPPRTHTDDPQGGPLNQTFGTIPMPSWNAPTDSAAQAGDAEQTNAEDQPLNRAERRARQRQDAQARRSQNPRR